MDDGERLALDRKSPYWMKGFTAGPLFNNINSCPSLYNLLGYGTLNLEK